jgi:ABC-type cobalamin/Fe3+-siderophores transport system ATPase subunit
MSFEVKVPQVGGEIFIHSVEIGDCAFVLGPNGSGKSSLMHHVYKNHQNFARRITAHRQNWLNSSAIDLSPYKKQQQENNIRAMDIQDQARWKDDHSAIRPSIMIFDLIDAENIRARAIAAAVDDRDTAGALAIASHAAPIKVINEILQLSNIPITISVQKNQEVMASKHGSKPYSAAQLSDGERNALLIAASVLTAESGSLILIDEPEQHLHRSISSPLLTQLFQKRVDCAFLISTHEVMLPLDHSDSNIILVRDCVYEESGNPLWEIDLVSADSDVDDALKADILGQRRKMLFVEGDDKKSLDKPLYSLLFPEISVVPKKSCKDVETSVCGVRGSEQMHWLRAFGIVDNDARTEPDRDRLREKGVYALNMYSVESIYYDPEVQRCVAGRHAAVTGEYTERLMASALESAIDAVRPHATRLAEIRAEKQIREKVFAHLPTRASVSARTDARIDLDVASTVDIEIHAITEAIANSDLTALIQRYPLRETPALDRIAEKLGFQDRQQFEGSVLTTLLENESLLEYVRSLFEPLISDISQ